LTQSIAEQLARVRRTGFTIAPEAGTQRMRDLINKGVTDADIETAARIAWGQGWGQLKMYFMIGLPTETDDDVRGIAETGIGVWRLAREMGHRRATVTVSASALIPKPHSTFQWEPMDTCDELRRKQRMILDTVRPHRPVRFKYHDVEEGVVECVLSRGDRRVGRVIEAAWRRGARFDSWSDHFDYTRWIACMQEAGLEPQIFLRRIPLHAKLPWDHIDTRVAKEFIIRDLHAGMKERFLPACEKPFIPRDPNKPVKPLENAHLVCYDCGLDCDLEAIKRERIANRDSLSRSRPEIAAAFRGERQQANGDGTGGRVHVKLPAPRSDGLAHNAFETSSGIVHGDAGGRDLSPVLATPSSQRSQTPAERLRYRVLFSKMGDLRWLSHLDLMRTLQRAFKRAGVSVSYSQGYHPAPLMSFGPALAVGIEGAAEFFDFESSAVLDTSATQERLNESLPAAVRVHKLERLTTASAPLSRCIDLAEYSAWLNQERRELTPEIFAGLGDFADPTEQERRIAALLSQPSLPVTRAGKKARTLDIRPFIRRLEFRAQSQHLHLWLHLGPNGQARAREVLEALYGVSGDCFRVRREALRSEQNVRTEMVIA
jgi:radical SAM-linked protein